MAKWWRSGPESAIRASMPPDEFHHLMRKPLESRDFNRIAKWLRQASSTERMEFLIQHFNHSSFWRLATSCINSRDEAGTLFNKGLDDICSAHSQKTKICVRFGISKLGAKRAISVIGSRIDSQPYMVDMALYWLPTMLDREQLEASGFVSLLKEAEQKSIIKPVKQTVSTRGKVTYSDRYGSD